jgi:bacteriorhodopsin
MADIDIVPKRGTSIWLWVILAVLALAVIFWFLSGDPSPVTQLQNLDGPTLAFNAADTAGELAA